MTSASLGSDHVNYLILRYLQETGHENTAVTFFTDWRRPPEFRDPENLPFAHQVRRRELVNVIQDGLSFDEINSRVRKQRREFRWAGAGDEVVENGVDGSRSGATHSNGKRKGRQTRTRRASSGGTSAPHPKRRRKSHDGVTMNGDGGREIDAASADADAAENHEAASPAMQSAEANRTDIPPKERYVSINANVQTDENMGPQTTTTQWRVDIPNAMILHSMFGPESTSRDPDILLVVGQETCRFYRISGAIQETNQVVSVDEPSLPRRSIVTASAWYPYGNVATLAFDGQRMLSEGRHVQWQSIISFDSQTGRTSQFSSPPLLEPSGIVLALRYSFDGQYLLAIRTNGRRGLIQVHKTSRTDADTHALVAWHIFSNPVMDAAWTGKKEFLVCGESGLVHAFTLEDEIPIERRNHTADSVRFQGLGTSTMSMPQRKANWDKVRVAASSGLVALASTRDRTIQLRRSEVAGWEHHELSGQLTALAFHPSEDVLACVFEEGFCTVFLGSSQKHTLQLVRAPVLALAWTPDGQHLAVASVSLVQIWDLDSIKGRDTASRQRLVTWKPEPGRNGERHEGSSLAEPSLSWNAKGDRLAIAMDDLVRSKTHRSGVLPLLC